MSETERLNRNVKMVVAYEGTRFAGFQRQREGILTIQCVLEDALRQITREKTVITGAGRTDAGVHARGQVINFHTRSRLEPERFLFAVNSLIPEDIIIISVEDVHPEFHARFSAKAKTYSYRIYNRRIRPVFERQFLYHHRYPLNPDLIRKAIVQIVGQHDFQSFQATGSAVTNTIRTIHFCRLEQNGPELRLEINADGFLYHMVRNIVGTLLLVGAEKMSPNEIYEVIKAHDRAAAGPTAPAHGLCLEEVFY